MRILLIHQAFAALGEPGGTRHHEFCRWLAENGHTVTVVTGRVSYLTGALVSPQGMPKEDTDDAGVHMELHPKLGPVQTAVQGVYLAGASQGAKDVRETMAQALAGAGKAGALLSRGVIEKEPLTGCLISDLCKGCMRCVKVCHTSAIEQIGQPGKDGTVRILEAACMGCGTCAAECNFDAIVMPYFTKEQILTQVDAALNEEPEKKCIVFTCNWCSYAGADLAGIEKRQYPASSRIIRTMCSARFEEDFIDHAFEKGAGAVLITGCRLTDTGGDHQFTVGKGLRQHARQALADETDVVVAGDDDANAWRHRPPSRRKAPRG